ncbi:MAG TPA: YceI family protein [Pseudonocardiaceae bacterium]|jgi:polyisoprenoid-binding protein YceI|nr:YceI family protein [Pseudonocardiaceae bacterium]
MSVATQPLTGTFVADPVHSSFQFAVKHMKISTYRASFDDVDARVVADQQGIRLDVAVRVESISIKNPPEFRAHVVHGADFFDAGNHPEITFRSEDVQLHDDGTVAVAGELTIKGITKPVVATGTYQPLTEDPVGSIRTAVELTATVDRRDWDMGWQAPLPGGGDALGYEVTLSVHVELIRQG